MSLTNCTNFTKSKSVTYNYFKHFLKCTELLVKENGKEGIAHLGSHVKQNSAHSHGLFNIKQSSLVLSSGSIGELHNQLVLSTMDKRTDCRQKRSQYQLSVLFLEKGQ